MSLRLIVTRGYGNGSFSGDIPNVTTRGYLPGLVPSEDVVDVFIPAEVRRKLRRMQQEAENKRKRRFREAEEARIAAAREMEEIYDLVVHGIEPARAEEIADIVRPVAASEDIIPKAEAIDFDQLVGRADLLRRMADLIGEIEVEMSAEADDEDLLLLMVI